jgi:CheY-like chemotaxis protein
VNDTDVSTNTILIADDDPDDQMLNRDAMQEARLPWQPIFLDNGDKLLAYLYEVFHSRSSQNESPPVLILLDLEMPFKNGWEALREISSDPELKQIPIVILTTSSSEEDRDRAYELGAAGFYTKPPSYRGLVAIMEEIYRKGYTA